MRDEVDVRLLELELKSSGIPFSTPEFRYRPLAPLNPDNPNPARILGLHLFDVGPGVLDFVTAAQPAVMKIYGDPSMASQIHERSPQTRVVYRLDCPDIMNEFIYSKPPVTRAAWFIEKLAEVVRPYVDRGEIAYIETPVYQGVYNNVGKAVEFELAFIAELERILPRARPLVATIAPGEPHESQYPLLLPLALEVERVGGALGYHSYWPVEEGHSLLDDEWQRYAGRFEGMDAFFRANGVQADWLLSECGPCGIIRDADFDDSILEFVQWSGWRHPQCFGGDWGATLADIGKFRQRLSTSPAHVVGATLFTVFSSPGYCEEAFTLGAEELATLARRSR